MKALKVGLDDDYLAYGVNKSILWNPEKTPHAVIIGPTGSGKTYFTKLALGKIALHVPDSKIVVCDFKGDDDFSFLENVNDFYRYDNCSEGLDHFFNLFKLRQSGEDTNRNMLVLFFDEWASYCNSLEKKALEEAKKKLSTLLMLGRSFNIQVIIGIQRCDASYFSTARDNFNLVVGLGNLSEESKRMVFNDFKKQMLPNKKQGTGYLLANGTDLKSIVVPTIRDMNKLHQTILKAVTR